MELWAFLGATRSNHLIAHSGISHNIISVGSVAVFASFQMCIQNNPNEARNMLLQNPQLAYALLQAQIVMKIVDPQVALVSFTHEYSVVGSCLTTDDFVEP